PHVAEIRAVIDVMVERGAVEVELEAQGTRIRVRLREDRPLGTMPIAAAPTAVVAAAHAQVQSGPAPVSAAAPPAREHHVFKSPMVGTFYRSPSPEAEVFVEVGSRVGPESTLCILEAMKVMNEIKAELSGTVVEVLAQNGEPIEFGQPLFLIDLD
ncbi:MAG: acetyl-CoA carboxylase biotin carboxyl carrier protein, partial [Planctomycetes bacterium]|nr:acetyl-CoA carboxylase biotin carboxyl carrier protein [Planctomycetota bacterium]